MMGFGRVAFEPDEPWFHAGWERRAFGLTLAMGGTGSWNIDESRHARESLPPAEYLSSSYYEIWTKGVERLVVQKGLVSEEELRLGQALTPPAALRRVIRAELGNQDPAADINPSSPAPARPRRAAARAAS